MKEHEIKLNKHNIHQKSCWCLYHTLRAEFVQSKEDFLCVIHDKMDHFKIALPWFQMTNKMVSKLGQLLVTLTIMIVHGHGDKIFIQYFNEL